MDFIISTLKHDTHVFSEREDHTYCAEQQGRKTETPKIITTVHKLTTKDNLRTADQLMKNTDFRNCVEEVILDEVNTTCIELTSKKEERSVLSHWRPMEKLSADSDSLLPEIIAEISTRYVHLEFVYDWL